MEPLLREPDEARVLHVDDSKSFLEVSRTYLEREVEDLTLRTETDPSDALEHLEDNRVDCIISDYDMPRMDGLAFLEAVRERENRIPFVLFTGKGSEEIAARAIEAGVDSYLRKESAKAQFTVLANRIQTLVNKNWARHRARKFEDTYELIAKTSTDAFWIRDIETGETLYSEGIRQFGYEPGIREDGFEWWAERIHPEDRTESRSLNDLQCMGVPEGFDDFDGDLGEFTHEYRWRCGNGEYVDCTSIGVVRFDGDEPVEMVGAMTVGEDWSVSEP